MKPMTLRSLDCFWAIGAGPGDPELLTLKAVSILQRAHVIYHAGPEPRQGRAWDIIRSHVRPEQEVRAVLAEPMRSVRASDWRAAYRPGVEQIAVGSKKVSGTAIRNGLHA